MRRIENIEDEMRGVVTYELDGGRRVCLDARSVREVGASKLLRELGLISVEPRDPIPVVQDGREIGNVPADFDPLFIRSGSWLYDPRPGDFVRSGDKWIASPQLGPGDLTAVPGFVWNDDHAKHKARLLEDSRSFLRAVTAL